MTDGRQSYVDIEVMVTIYFWINYDNKFVFSDPMQDNIIIDAKNLTGVEKSSERTSTANTFNWCKLMRLKLFAVIP